MTGKLTPKRMRQIAWLDSRPGAPVGNALEKAADHIEALTDALRRIEKEATRCRGSQSRADTIRFIIDVAKVHRTLPEESA